MQVQALDLRKGNLVSYEGRMCTVTFWNILRNDRRLFVQLKLKDLASGRVTELKEHGDSKYELLESETIELTFSYQDGADAVFFTAEGEEVRCPHVTAADALQWQADAYDGFFVSGKLVTVSPPAQVPAKVKETSPPMKGQGSGFKDAVLENGIKVRVGLNADVGDTVRIDTQTLEQR